jgi:hypothetical protein
MKIFINTAVKSFYTDNILKEYQPSKTVKIEVGKKMPT